jgi:predicted permease
MAVVGLVLLIACANVASMLLARASSRQKEIGIRLALGASRGRLVRQLVTEAVVLSLIGAVAGTVLAWWLTSAAAAVTIPLPIPLSFEVHVDARVLAFTLAATAIAGLLAGLAPAMQALKPDVTNDLRGDAPLSRTAGRRWSLRDALVAGQMAITALLLIIAALLTRSLVAAERTDPGFAAARLAIVSTDTATLRYDENRSRQFFDEAMAKIAEIPGVESVALASRVPLQVNANRWEIWIPGRHRPGDHGDTVEVTTVSPEFFKTLGVAIAEGRGFTNDDRPDTPRVAVVNETLARRFWPGESAIGKVFHTRGGEGPAFRIVGVSADHKVLTLSERPTPFLHVARSQRPGSYSAIVARTRGDAAALLRDMRRALVGLDPNVVFIENQTMEAEVDATLLPMRVSAWLVSGVGMAAMLLAAIGLYGVIAYSVACRTREIGIRIALGARRGMVVRMVMRQGLAVALAGLMVGCVLAAATARAIAGVLYGITAADPVSWLAAAAVLIAVAAVANAIPAARAARVQPIQALRTE